MKNNKPTRRKPPTRKEIEKWLKSHGHEEAEIASVSNKSSTKEAVVELHVKEKKHG
jgi:hypothetical protein